MNRNELMTWLSNHIFMQRRRTIIRDTNLALQYRYEYSNGDVYEHCSEYTDNSRMKEHCNTWINGKLVYSADYIYHNFGWKEITA